MTGIAAADDNFSIELSLNPAGDQATIQNLLPGVNEIAIYNIAGQKIFSDEVHNLNGRSYSMNVSKLNAGFYLCSVTNKGQRKLARLLIH
jgi:hypothetical protein